jgi:hypothetical protein
MISRLLSAEPNTWIVIFHPRTDCLVSRFLSFGHFKHVSALGYMPEMRAWITYDVGRFGNRVTMVPKGQEWQLGPWVEGCTLVVMPKRPMTARFPPIWGWCVPSVRRLIGLRSSALQTGTFYRHCLRDGGKVISDPNLFKGTPAASG